MWKKPAKTPRHKPLRAIPHQIEVHARVRQEDDITLPERERSHLAKRWAAFKESRKERWRDDD
jgi:hypothetical protein